MLFHFLRAFWGLLFLFFLVVGFGQDVGKLNWKRERIARGVRWQYVHTDELFDSKQFISVLMVSKKRDFRIDFENKVLKPTSQFAAEENALVAMNAGFFNMQAGGSVTFMKVDGQVINQNTDKNEMLTQNCIAIDEGGRMFILASANTDSLSRSDDVEDVLFTGPLLIWNGAKMDLAKTKFNHNRHPRTCACSTSNGKTLLVTVDGRSVEAAGMSLHELTELLMGLNCRQAINLDGGGSTTMWIKGKGVVNHPSDNGKFDAAGERKVANVILVE